ncbi:MAG: type I methionyl aminopeptidase [Firmicutes bacterium]|nr:type I methionyl aminopeptidase [Bacillota bacterium]
MIILKSKDEVAKMREAGRLVALAHGELEKVIAPGISTKELDSIVEKFLEGCGATPAFKGYHGFPASICVAINDQVVHGIPGDHKLEMGDIVGIDIGVLVDGYYGDAARTYPVGQVSREGERLIDITREALWRGIGESVVGNRLSDVSHAIQCCVEQGGFSVVRDFVGHGIGRAMHEEPQVPNFGEPGHGPRLKPGMTLALEPMVTTGHHDVMVLADGWTVVTRDSSLSAHFEHTICVSEDGPLVLTEA